MSKLFIVLAAVSAVFISPGASSAEMVGKVSLCRATDAPPRTGGIDESRPQTKEPFYYQNAAGEADDALAIKIDNSLAGDLRGMHVLDCHVVGAIVAQNPHNEPIPVKGMKWHMVRIDGKDKVPMVAEALEDFVSVQTDGK